MKKVTCCRCWKIKNPFCDKCENKGVIYDTQLSKNFTLSELTYSRTAERLKIPNDPTIKQIDRLVELTRNIGQPLRDSMGRLRVTSGVRCSEELNKAVKGAKDSSHLWAYAMDVQPLDCTLTDLMYWFSRTKLPFDQAIIEYGRRPDEDQDDWFHVGYKHVSGAQRRQLLVMKDNQYSIWTP